MKVLLKDLPKHKELIGKRINVTRQGGYYHYDYQDKPMQRVFEGAKLHKDKDGSLWVSWNWKTEYDERQVCDCGYSSVSLGKYHKGSYLIIN